MRKIGRSTSARGPVEPSSLTSDEGRAVSWLVNVGRVGVAVMAEGFLHRSGFVKVEQGKEMLVYSSVEEFVERERRDSLVDEILSFAIQCRACSVGCLLLRDQPSAAFVSVMENNELTLVWGITQRESLQVCQMLEVSPVPSAADFNERHVGRRRVAVGLLRRGYEERRLFTHLNYTPPGMSAVAIALEEEEEEEEGQDAADVLRRSSAVYELSIIEEVNPFEETEAARRWSTIICCGLSAGEEEVRKCFRRILNSSRTGVVLPGGGSTILALGNLLEEIASEEVQHLELAEVARSVSRALKVVVACREVVQVILANTGMEGEEAARRMSSFPTEMPTSQGVQHKIRQHARSLRRNVADESFWRDRIPLRFASIFAGSDLTEVASPQTFIFDDYLGTQGALRRSFEFCILLLSSSQIWYRVNRKRTCFAQQIMSSSLSSTKAVHSTARDASNAHKTPIKL
eukprot:766958-Hanusia_phi.AAC.3